MPRLGFESSLEILSVKVSGRWTSVKLEPQFIAALHEAARAEGRSIEEICSNLSEARERGSLASALRLYVAEHFRGRAGNGAAYGRMQEVMRELVGNGDVRIAMGQKEVLARRELGLEQLNGSARLLGGLFQYWKELTRGASMPALPGQMPLQRRGIDTMLHLIDVEADDPDRFVILRQAPITVIYRRGNNVPLSALGATLYSRELKADYVAAKFRRAPLLERVWARTPEGEIRYHRLILPGSADGRTKRLLIGVAPVEEARQARPLRGAG